MIKIIWSFKFVLGSASQSRIFDKKQYNLFTVNYQRLFQHYPSFCSPSITTVITLPIFSSMHRDTTTWFILINNGVVWASFHTRFIQRNIVAIFASLHSRTRCILRNNDSTFTPFWTRFILRNIRTIFTSFLRTRCVLTNIRAISAWFHSRTRFIPRNVGSIFALFHSRTRFILRNIGSIFAPFHSRTGFILRNVGSIFTPFRIRRVRTCRRS